MWLFGISRGLVYVFICNKCKNFVKQLLHILSSWLHCPTMCPIFTTTDAIQIGNLILFNRQTSFPRNYINSKMESAFFILLCISLSAEWYISVSLCFRF